MDYRNRNCCFEDVKGITDDCFRDKLKGIMDRDCMHHHPEEVRGIMDRMDRNMCCPEEVRGIMDHDHCCRRY